MASGSHDVVDPAVLYFGTPVVLVSTVSDDGTTNLAPISSIFWLGHTAVIGVGCRSRTAHNLRETGECVLNLPSVNEVGAVDRLALTTGRDPVPERKHEAGYRYCADKFARAGLTAQKGDVVRAPRALECPVNLEGRLLSGTALQPDGGAQVFQIEVVRVHVHPSIRQVGTANRVDPDAWRPLLMSFQKFYGPGAQVHPSRLSGIDEEWYR